jgi:mutator protein MutT
MPPPLRRVQAALALVECSGKILICRRPRHVRFGGYWEFPGGKRQPRESWAACVRREVREEVGITLRALRCVCTLTYRCPGERYRLEVFQAAWRAGVAQPLQAQEVKWVAPLALGRYRFPPANAPLIRALSRKGFRAIISVNNITLGRMR